MGGSGIPAFELGQTLPCFLEGVRVSPDTGPAMFDTENRTQASCRETGLSCEECTGQTATELARTCKGLRGKMVAQLFVQLYPEPACSRMHGHFSAAYREASREEVHGNDWEDMPMRVVEPVVERRPRVMFAVA